MTRRPNRWTACLALIPLALVWTACQEAPPAEPPPAPPAERVENPAVGVALANVSGFTVAKNGETFVLRPTDGLAGEVTIVAGEEGKVNLVQAVHDHQASIVALPGGAYRGQREMVGPLGTAYYSRGTYTAETPGGNSEETTILTLHPNGDRILRLEYRYPAGDDSSARLEALMQNVLGELEAVASLAPGPVEGG